jgi:U3 small nucleolar RNA-associated protein 14
MLEAEGGESDIEEGMLKREVERARERATLKHKQTGKWAKRMKQQEYLDGNGREQIEEMLHRGEQLRRKIQGLGSDESGEEESSSDDEEDDEVDVDTEQGILKIKKAAFDELKQLEDQIETESNQKERGVFQMKFMKEAMARKQAATDRMMDDFVKELGADVANGSGDEDEQNDEIDTSSGVLTNRTGGRTVYRPGALQQLPPPRTMNSLASDTSSVTLKSTDFASTPDPPRPPQTSSGLSHTTTAPLGNPQVGRDESNPWLTRNSDISTKIARKKNELFGKDSQKSEKSKNKLKKLARKRQEEREKAQEDARVEISMDQNLVLNNPSSSSKPQTSASPSQPITGVNTTTTTITSPNIHEPGDSSDANSELDAQEAALLKTKQDANPKGPKAFQQRDLVALAFAGDNVVHVRLPFPLVSLLA